MPASPARGAAAETSAPLPFQRHLRLSQGHASPSTAVQMYRIGTDLRRALRKSVAGGFIKIIRRGIGAMAWCTHPGGYRCVYAQSTDQGMQCLGSRDAFSDTAKGVDDVVQFLAFAEAVAHGVISTRGRTAGQKQITDSGEGQECQRRCSIGCSYPGHLCKPPRDQHYRRAN